VCHGSFIHVGHDLSQDGELTDLKIPVKGKRLTFGSLMGETATIVSSIHVYDIARLCV